jgi:hypothetical protein
MAADMTAPANTRTFFLLCAEFGTAQIPLEKCCHHFGLKPDEAKRAAVRQALPVPVFRLGSQKSPWMVSADALAAYIDAKHEEAAKEWKRIHQAA